MAKFYFILTIILLGGATSLYSQSNEKDLKNFVNSFSVNYYPNSDHFENNNSNLLTISFLVVSINKKYVPDSVYLTDSTPEWQHEALKHVQKKLNLNALSKYARHLKFVGNIVFPLILKSEIPRAQIDQSETYSTYKNLFLHNGISLKGTCRLEEPIIIIQPVLNP